MAALAERPWHPPHPRLVEKAKARPEQKLYHPRGENKTFLLAKDPEVLCAGPAGTGKTRTGCEKIHLVAEKYPGARILIARKSRKSLTDTAMVTLEDHVMPVGHPAKRGARRTQRSSYYYPNGSEIVCGGLDNPDKVMSAEYDVIYIPEATELLLEDWEKLTTRLRNGVVPYQQIIADANPATPQHWLKKRCESGLCRMISTTHEDNPRLFNHSRGEWTEEGKRYLSVLDRLSGARLQRLRHGKWVAPEGSRFPHAIRDVQGFHADRRWREGLPEYFTKWVSIDFGLAAPYCALWHTMDPEGTVYTYREDYGPGFTADVQAKRVVDLSAANEHYYAEFLDPAMWNKHAFAKDGDPTDADIYESAFKKDHRFGPLEKGYNKSRNEGFNILDNLLNRDNGFNDWYIDFSCENLWRELEEAIFHKNPTTGIISEDLDPNSDDHALTCAYYGLMPHLRKPRAKVDPNKPVDYDEVIRLRREKELLDAINDASGNARRVRI